MDFKHYLSVIDSLPVAILVARKETDAHHTVAHLNPLFIEAFGYTIEDIPDKQTWWSKAYPDPSYREAVSRQWEFEFQLAADREQDEVSTTVSITNKSGQERRYRVASSIATPVFDNIYPVLFIPLDSAK